MGTVHCFLFNDTFPSGLLRCNTHGQYQLEKTKILPNY